MSSRILRGSCQCGRNQYMVNIPADSHDVQVLFDTDAVHRISSASPLSAFLRVPLSWYHSRTVPFFPDEIRSVIRRIYCSPWEQSTMRHFCGFCGTPLSYWTEQPRTEADYIQLTLGSLLSQDLRDLEEMGLIPDDSSEEAGEGEGEGDRMDLERDESTTAAVPTTEPSMQLIGREFTSVPWFERMMQGSRLGNMRTSKGVQQSEDGRVRVEWEISEWTANDDDAEAALADDDADSSSTGKRKRGTGDQGDGSAKASAR